MRLDNVNIELLREWFASKMEVVKTLPNIKTVEDFKTVFILQTDGTYKRYQAIKGKWYLSDEILTEV